MPLSRFEAFRKLSGFVGRTAEVVKDAGLPTFGRKLIRPPILLITTFVVLVLVVLFEQHVNMYRHGIEKVRDVYATAVRDTRTELAGLTRGIAQDTSLKQNLKWKLVHSVQRFLEARSVRGTLDQIVIFNRKCQLLGSSSLLKNAPFQCPWGRKGARSGKFYWIEGPSAPGLGYIQTLAGSSHHVSGIVYLDAEWLAKHRSLNTLVETLNLSIMAPGDGDRSVLVREGEDAKGRAIASLIADRSLDAVLTAVGTYKTNVFWPLVSLTFLFMGLWWWSERCRKRAQRSEQRQFIAWCQSLNPAAQPIDDQTINLQTAEKYVSQAIQNKLDIIRGLQNKREALERTVQDQERQSQTYRHRLSEVAELDTLGIQLKRTTDAFLENAKKTLHASDSATSLLKQAIASDLVPLRSTLKAWQNGIATRGSRKFIRSLAETKGENGQSLLDDQLQTITKCNEGLIQKVNTVSEHLEDHQIQCEFSTKVAAYWRGLAFRCNPDEAAIDLRAPIAHAQRLINLEHGNRKNPFANLIEEQDARSVPPIPATIWSAGLYHVYLTLTEKTFPGEAKIVTRMRHDKSRILLVITIAGEPTAYHPTTEPMSIDTNRHLEIAKAMLAPYHVGIQVLPSLDGLYPIALSWDHSTIHSQPRATLQESTNANTESHI